MQDIFHDVSRKSSRLHGSRLSAHVHQDQRLAVAGGDFSNPWIAFQPGHIVEKFRTCAERDLRDAGPARIHGNGNFQTSAERLKNRKNAIHLYGGRCLSGTRARRFATDVEEVGARSLNC